MGFSIKADDDDNSSVGEGMYRRVLEMQKQIYTAPFKLFENPKEETHYIRNGLILAGLGFLGYKGYQYYKGSRR